MERGAKSSSLLTISGSLCRQHVGVFVNKPLNPF